MGLIRYFTKALSDHGIGTEKFIAGEIFAALRDDDGARLNTYLFAQTNTPDINILCLRDYQCANYEDDLDPLTFALQHAKPNCAGVIAKYFPHLLADENENGHALFARVLQGDSLASVRTLIDIGQDARKPDRHGNIALHYAAMGAGQHGILPYLVQQWNVRDARNARGETPLMLAAGSGVTESIDWLLEARADIHLHDHEGLNATMHAIRGAKFRAASYLMANWGRVDFRHPMVERQKEHAHAAREFDFVDTLFRVRQRQEKEAADIAAQKQAESRAVHQAFVLKHGGYPAPITARFRL